MDINELTHVIVEGLAGHSMVLVLNDGALITAEDRAMLQALYSRDPKSVLMHLEKLAEVGSGKFMEQYYVGYGHKSIGDCGDTTIFVEGVSMLVAKAIQDWALYNGQEVSTRYVDYTGAPMVNPLGIMPEENPQEKLRAFYVAAMPAVKEHLKQQYPRNDGEKEGDYEKAIAARAFDILRSMLPAGASTSLSWHTNLRQAADKLCYLRMHPLVEVRQVAGMIDEALKKAHPNSFNHKRYDESERYRKKFMNENYYFVPSNWPERVVLAKDSLDWGLLAEHADIIQSRPAKAELPKQLAEIGTLRFEFLLDFGSFRDLQRQRAVTQRMPLLTPTFGFHPWYLKQLPSSLQPEATALIDQVRLWWWNGKRDETVLQYYLPMGYRVPCRVTGDLPAHVYLAELRAGTTVHPTLREVAQDIGREIRGLGIPVFIDESDMGRFDVKRGKQDIVERKA